MGAITAEPLSYNHMIKEVVDEVRSITKEEDEQIASDDNIKAHLQWAVHNMQKIVPMIKDEYIMDIPFVVDYENDWTSTLVRPTTSKQAQVVKIKSSPDSSTAPALDATSGLYDFHYQHPTNFIILGWKDLYNALTGTCRRTSDFSQLQGHARNYNTQLARTVAWHAFGRNLYVSVREGMIDEDGASNVVVTGVGWRTPIKLIETVAAVTPTGVDVDHPSSDEDETKRQKILVNDWDPIDCPDDYVPLAVNLASIKVWSQVGKLSKEQETAALERAYGQHFESSEMQLANREVYRKDTQWKDRGHQ